MKSISKTRTFACAVFAVALALIISVAAYAADASVKTQWARSTVTAPSDSTFLDVGTDADGNTYAVGYVDGNGAYDFGNGVIVNGSVAAGISAILVKYDVNGNAQWARNAVQSLDFSAFSGVCLDSSGNIYVSGMINGNTLYDFGNGATVTGAGAPGITSTLLVKYGADGTAQWARTTAVNPGSSGITRVSVDGSGNSICASGIVTGSDTFNFGNGVTVAGAYADGNSLLVVKYDSNGVAQWARSTTQASDQSMSFGVSVDNSGNTYAVGFATGNNQFGFGNGQTVTPPVAGDNNMIVVKYNAAGDAQWARSTTAASDMSFLYDCQTDGSGNLFVAGMLFDTTQFSFGNGVQAAGPAASNGFILKYDTNGVPQWVTTTTGTSVSTFYQGLELDTSGNIYVAGKSNGNGAVDFGNSVTARGAWTNDNIMTVGYDSNGTARWARTTAAGQWDSGGAGIAVDSVGNVLTVGAIYDSIQFDLGDGVTVSGGHAGMGSSNAVAIKYASPAVPTLPYTGR